MKVQTRTLKLYVPHAAQLRIHRSKARFRVAAFGRQSGKSTACVNELAWRAWQKPNGTFWFVSPTADQARIQYRRLVGMLMSCPGVILKKNQTELRVKLINNSQIVFKSGEVFDNLRSETLDGVVVDEVRDQHPDLWRLILRPMLATTGGWALFVSTPRGFDQFYDLAQKALTNPNWETFHAPSTCNPLWTQLEFDEAKEDMGEAEFAQEILAEFREMGVGKVYVNHGTHNHVDKNPFAEPGQTWSPHLPIVVGLDFNVGLMCWIMGQVKGESIYYGDEIAEENTNTQKCAELLADKVAGHRSGVVLIGDASGKARKTSSSETDYQILLKVLRDRGISVRNLSPESNPLIKDRVNIVNAGLKSASGEVNVFYDPIKCPIAKKDFERVAWKKNAQGADFDKTDPKLTHMSDAAGYPVCYYANVLRSRPARMRVFIRS